LDADGRDQEILMQSNFGDTLDSLLRRNWNRKKKSVLKRTISLVTSKILPSKKKKKIAKKSMFFINRNQKKRKKISV
jgi:hypothetical protein